MKIANQPLTINTLKQFVPVEITTNKKKKIERHYAILFWNRLPAIDKNNYEGNAPNRFGRINNLEKFSLDASILNSVHLEKRLVSNSRKAAL